jgi:formamidopyrimidine-DNA glycosylase
MPELPDVTIYLDALRPRLVGQPLERVRLTSPFVLRSVEPPIAALIRCRVVDLRRLGKRIVLCFDGDLYAVIHLMIAGRLRWEKRGAKPPGKIGLAAFDFPAGTLLLTEASPKKRAALYVVGGAAALATHDPGGLEVLDASLDAFRAALRSENHTLKRALTDPRLFSGIGNAYSDELLHAARLSPVQLTGKLIDAEVERLYAATQRTLRHWIQTRIEFGDRVPGAGESPRFAPLRGTALANRVRVRHAVQRIRYADNETNYCPACQTGGRARRSFPVAARKTTGQDAREPSGPAAAPRRCVAAASARHWGPRVHPLARHSASAHSTAARRREWSRRRGISY